MLSLLTTFFSIHHTFDTQMQHFCADKAGLKQKMKSSNNFFKTNLRIVITQGRDFMFCNNYLFLLALGCIKQNVTVHRFTELVLQTFMLKTWIVVFSRVEEFFPNFSVRVFVIFNWLGHHFSAVSRSHRREVSEIAL